MAVKLPTTGSIENVRGTLTLFQEAGCKGIEGIQTESNADLSSLELNNTKSVLIGSVN